jgi:hypothetical protein
MSDVTRVIDQYVAIWSETDAERRRDLIAQTFTEDAVYLGPRLGGNGHDGIEALAQELQMHMRGYQFTRISEIDAHHNVARYSWEILKPDETGRFAAGVDFGDFADDGRLRSVTVFLDEAPTQADAHHDE